MRIFDTFLFDGELSLLEHRLAETADLVDVYVLVEAGETFRGEPKPLAFAAARSRFAAYEAKIRHVQLPRLGPASTDAWSREKNQRDAVLFALQDAAADDIILILDADEIPSRSLLEKLRTNGLDHARRLLMTRHYETLDRIAPRSPCCPDPYAPFPFAHRRMRPGSWDALAIDWFSRSGVAAPYRDLLSERNGQATSVHELRRSVAVAGALPDAGRHLCFVDPAANPSRKLGRMAHAELAGDRAQSVEHLVRCRRYGIHHRGWWYAERPTGELPLDLQRLCRRIPSLVVADGSSAPIRRLVRTWAWLRTWKALPDWTANNIDRRFDAWWPLLAMPLLLLDAIGIIAAGVARRRARRVQPLRHPLT